MSNGFVQKLRETFGLVIIEDTDLEIYCKKHFRTIPNIAYKNKRKIQSLSYSMFLNELITPNAWKISELKHNTVISKTDSWQRIRNIGNIVAKKLTWTDDKNLDTSGDYYLYPSEALTIKKCDCEDHAFVMASALPQDLGVAYGFFTDGKAKIAHAFNVFMSDGVLYTADTVSDTVEMRANDDISPWVVHYIITERYTFAVRSGVAFGEIAGYE